MEIGDYVNYPVYYDNVNCSTLKGWRVISKNIDLDGNPSPGTVNLVSAGVPLTYYHYMSAPGSLADITTNFFETKFSSTENRAYRKSGFLPYITLKEIFDNKYTEISGDKLQVRSMNEKDICNAQKTETNKDWSRDIGNKKYNRLFTCGAIYYVAYATSSCLWFIDGEYVGNYGGGYKENSEFRN